MDFVAVSAARSAAGVFLGPKAFAQQAVPSRIVQL
jgi:hypothetical protein